MGFKPMIKTFNDPKYYPNALVFGSKPEAEDWARDLMGRWTLAQDWRVDEVDDAPTHTYIDGQLGHLENTEPRPAASTGRQRLHQGSSP